MKFGTLYSYWGNTWSCDYLETAKRVRKLGFDILEIGAGHLLEMEDEEILALRNLARDLGLTITCNIGPPKDKDVASSDASVRRAGIKFLTDIMNAMNRLDSKIIVGVQYTYWPNDFSDLDKPAIWKRGVESMKKLAVAAVENDVRICLEVVNRFETHILNTAAEANQFCDEVGSDNVGVLLDTFHMNIEEDNIAEAIRTSGSRLWHLHVGEGNRKVPGEGSLPWAEIGKSLRDIRFDGGVVMEPFYYDGGQVGKDIKVWRDISEGASPEEMDTRIADSLTFLRKNFLTED
ncbi:MAG: sugar phosphate isomerase/epimerase [Spirochaetia bacterium]|nr:sugar phosphate isomerase/epimerase [Spirochaetia bacterium]